MNTRIRYELDETGSDLLKSTIDFLAVNEIVYVKLNTRLLKGRVIKRPDTQNVQIIMQFEAKTLAGLKKAAKDALIELGVVFQDEVRPRMKTYDKIEVDKIMDKVNNTLNKIEESRRE